MREKREDVVGGQQELGFGHITDLCVISDVIFVIRVGKSNSHWRLQVQHVGDLPRNSEPISFQKISKKHINHNKGMRI